MQIYRFSIDYTRVKIIEIFFRNTTVATVEQELIYVGNEEGKIIAMRDLIHKVSYLWTSDFFQRYCQIKFLGGRKFSFGRAEKERFWKLESTHNCDCVSQRERILKALRSNIFRGLRMARDTCGKYEKKLRKVWRKYGKYEKILDMPENVTKTKYNIENRILYEKFLKCS